MTPTSSVLDADEFQFVLVDPAGDVVAPATVALEMVSWEESLVSMVVVRTGVHWGPVEVTTVLLDAPSEVDPAWEDVEEFSVTCSGGLQVRELMGSVAVSLCSDGGEYRVRISASGRAAGAALDYDELAELDPEAPVERYLIEAWASPPSDAVTLRSAEQQPEFVAPAAQFADAGIAAARRIHRSLDRDLPLSGDRGTSTAERHVPGTRRQLFSGFRHIYGWLTSGAGPGDDVFSMDGTVDDSYFGRADLIVPCEGEILCTVVESKSPSHVLMTWTWSRLSNDRRRPAARDDRPAGPLIPSEPQMTVRFDLTNAEPAEHWPTTRVRVTHDHVPIELADDLSAYWAWTLERADHDFDLSKARKRRAAESRVR